MGAVFKTVCETVRAGSGPVRLRHASANSISICDFGFGICLCKTENFIFEGNYDAGRMKARTKQFALRVIRLTESLPNTKTANVIGNQLLRSGTSVGAIIARRVGQNQLPILFQVKYCARRKMTSQFIGWNFL